MQNLTTHMLGGLFHLQKCPISFLSTTFIQYHLRFLSLNDFILNVTYNMQVAATIQQHQTMSLSYAPQLSSLSVNEKKLKLHLQQTHPQSPSRFIYVQRALQNSTPSLYLVNIHCLILIQLKGAQFRSLLNLSLANNQICNIQAIQFIRAPMLQSLSLMMNNIIQITPLRKTVFPRLNTLRLSMNPIRDILSLSEMISPTAFTQLALEMHTTHDDMPPIKTYQQSIAPICKMQAATITSIKIITQGRVAFERQHLQIKQRFNAN